MRAAVASAAVIGAAGAALYSAPYPRDVNCTRINRAQLNRVYTTTCSSFPFVLPLALRQPRWIAWAEEEHVARTVSSASFPMHIKADVRQTTGQVDSNSKDTTAAETPSAVEKGAGPGTVFGSAAVRVAKRFSFSGAGIRRVKILGVLPFDTYAVGFYVRPSGKGYQEAFAACVADNEADFFESLRSSDTEKVFRIVPVRDIDGPHMHRALSSQIRLRMLQTLTGTKHFTKEQEIPHEPTVEFIFKQLHDVFPPGAKFIKGTSIDFICLRNGIVAVHVDGELKKEIISPTELPRLFAESFAAIYLGEDSVTPDAKKDFLKTFRSSFVELADEGSSGECGK